MVGCMWLEAVSRVVMHVIEGGIAGGMHVIEGGIVDFGLSAPHSIINNLAVNLLEILIRYIPGAWSQEV